jgi:hypothetical protein
MLSSYVSHHVQRKPSHNREDNVDTTWVPASYSKIRPPPLLLKKVLASGTIKEYERMSCKPEMYYTKAEQVVTKSSTWVEIRWHPPPYEENHPTTTTNGEKLVSSDKEKGGDKIGRGLDKTSADVNQC